MVHLGLQVIVAARAEDADGVDGVVVEAQDGAVLVDFDLDLVRGQIMPD